MTFIQEDFGGFNTRFLGVKFNFSDEGLFQYYLKYLKEEKLPSSTELNEIAIKSVMEHEIRHYHDFLLSPYCSALFRLRLQGMINGIQSIDFLKNMSGSVIPLPMTQWARLNDHSRSIYKSEWESYYDPENGPLEVINVPPLITPDEAKSRYGYSPVDINDLSEEEKLLKYLQASIAGYDQMNVYTKGITRGKTASELIPMNIFEITAVAIQIYTIMYVDGTSSVTSYLRFINSSALGWAKLFRNFFKLSTRSNDQFEAFIESPPNVIEHRITNILKMATWCMLGNYFVEDMKACPTNRFAMIMELAIMGNQANPDNFNSTQGYWDFLDDRCNVFPWRSSIQKMHESDLKKQSDYEKILEMWNGEDDTVPKQALHIFNQMIKHQKSMIDILVDHPDDYILPHNYIKAKTSIFPVPLVKYELINFGIHESSIDLKNKHVVNFTNTEKGKLITEYIVGENDLAASAKEFEWNCYITDTLFSDRSVPLNYVSKIRELISTGSNKTLFSVVG